MKLKDLPVGSTIAFGKRRIDSTRWYNGHSSMKPYDECVDLTWSKVTEDGHLMCLNNTYYLSVDCPRPLTGRTVRQKKYGHTLFFKTALCKMLNSSIIEVPEDQTEFKHYFTDYDYTGERGRELGFLYNFNQDEKEKLVKHTMTIDTPVGYTKEFGKSVSEDLYVTMPTTEMIRSFNNRYGNYLYNGGADTMLFAANKYGNVARVSVTRRLEIDPVIMVNGDSLFEYDDVLSRWYLVEDIKTFDKDLSSFLTM